MSFNLEGFENTTEALGLYIDFGNLFSHRLNKRGGKPVPCRLSFRDFDFGPLLLFFCEEAMAPGRLFITFSCSLSYSAP